jgi:hypothetical protein
MITEDGPRFFDLEKSVLDTDGEISKDDFSRLQQEELEGLHEGSRSLQAAGAPCRH